MLEPRRLALLVGVADLGSISAAAAAAGCTPSAASEQLAKLERELGVALLERSPRSVRLTAAGVELAVHGRRILEAHDTARQAVSRVAGLSAGRLRLAAHQTSAEAYVVPSIAAFRRRHPGVELSFVELESEEAIPAVQQGNIDIAIVFRYLTLQAPDTANLTVTALDRHELALAVPDRLASAGGTVSLAEFADEPWISARPAEGFQAITELAAARAGFSPQVVARVESYDLLLDFVATGLGVALVPRELADHKPGVRLLNIADPQGLAREALLIRRVADHSPSTAEMSRLILDRV